MWQIQQYLPDLMENLFPTSLREYCSYFRISFLDLKLHCIFCKGICDLVDLAHFVQKELKVVWRHNTPYACCNNCLKLCARYESEHHAVCSVKAENLHGLIGLSLQEICVRCNYCLGVLTSSEKVDLITSGRYTWLVRGYWRAICSRCSKREL
uniref:Protein E6 n=1 Tax=Human papillomavirus TaxID=10566 RepID=A0A385PPK4_9PAPI|nr:MAG: E6 protein [Human papillomavirus]